jgi:hypothetical protein
MLDPGLLLSQYGLVLVQSLGDVLELWSGRELWHILDNPSFDLTPPEWAMPPTELALSPALQTEVQQKRGKLLPPISTCF